MAAGKSFRNAVIAGGFVILLGVIMTFFYVSSVEGIPQGFQSPILALEFISSQSAAETFFNGNTDLIGKFHIGHYLDMAFLLAYGLLLGFANLGAWQLRDRSLNLMGILAAISAGTADLLENLLLIQLTGTLLYQEPAPNFILLRFFVSIKFVAIAISMLCLVPLLWQQRALGKIYGIATALVVVSTALTLSGYYPASTAMMLVTAIAWLALCLWLFKTSRQLST